jgi:hypothetical protein
MPSFDGGDDFVWIGDPFEGFGMDVVIFGSNVSGLSISLALGDAVAAWISEGEPPMGIVPHEDGAVDDGSAANGTNRHAAEVCSPGKRPTINVLNFSMF